MPLIRNAVTFSFCQVSRSSRTTIAIFVSNMPLPLMPPRGFGSQPALQLPLDDVPDDPHAVRAVVEAGQVREGLAAVMHEDLPVLDVELLEGLEAIGREARGHEGDAFHSALGQGL